jgi:hypothetical protein
MIPKFLLPWKPEDCAERENIRKKQKKRKSILVPNSCFFESQIEWEVDTKFMGLFHLFPKDISRVFQIFPIFLNGLDFQSYRYRHLSSHLQKNNNLFTSKADTFSFGLKKTLIFFSILLSCCIYL